MLLEKSDGMLLMVIPRAADCTSPTTGKSRGGGGSGTHSTHGTHVRIVVILVDQRDELRLGNDRWRGRRIALTMISIGIIIIKIIIIITITTANARTSATTLRVLL